MDFSGFMHPNAPRQQLELHMLSGRFSWFKGAADARLLSGDVPQTRRGVGT